MQVTIDPDLALVFFLDLLHEALNRHHFWMELWFRVNPLAIEIDSSHRVTVVSNDDSIRIHARNEYKGIESPEILCFTAIRCNKVINT